jgi:carnitine O-acetyltransferase
MGEHSPVDALVPSIVAEYAIVGDVCEKEFDATPEDIAQSVTASGQQGWDSLQWAVDDKIQEECLNAEERAKELIADSDDDVFWFEGYGADWIKNVGMY